MERSFADFYERGRLSKVRGTFKKFGLWFLGAIGLGITAYVSGIVTEVLPALRDVVCLAKERFHEPAPGTHFTILISNLADDSDGRQTRHVRDVFLNERGLDVRRTCRVVRLDAVGGSVADAAAQAREEGNALLSYSSHTGSVRRARPMRKTWRSRRGLPRRLTKNGPKAGSCLRVLFMTGSSLDAYGRFS